MEEAGNQVLLQATRAVQAFAYQLAYPKVFDARGADAVLDSGRHRAAARARLLRSDRPLVHRDELGSADMTELRRNELPTPEEFEHQLARFINETLLGGAGRRSIATRGCSRTAT